MYNDCCQYLIEFNCINDDGLLIDDAPIGKTFQLIDDLGLRAVITITKVHTDDEKVNSIHSKERKFPKIPISTQNGKIVLLSIFQGDDDAKAFREYLLWQDFFKWSDSSHEEQQRILSDFFSLFIA